MISLLLLAIALENFGYVYLVTRRNGGLAYLFISLSWLILNIGVGFKLFLLVVSNFDANMIDNMLGSYFTQFHFQQMNSDNVIPPLSILFFLNSMILVYLICNLAFNKNEFKKNSPVKINSCVTSYVGFFITMASGLVRIGLGLGNDFETEHNYPLKIEAITFMLNAYVGPLILIISILDSNAYKSRNRLFWFIVVACLNYVLFPSKYTLCLSLGALFMRSFYFNNRNRRGFLFIVVLVTCLVMIYPFLNIYREVKFISGDASTVIDVLISLPSIYFERDGSAYFDLSSIYLSPFIKIIGRMGGGDCLVLIADYISQGTFANDIEIGSINQVYQNVIFMTGTFLVGGYSPSLAGQIFLYSESVFLTAISLAMYVALGARILIKIYHLLPYSNALYIYYLIAFLFWLNDGFSFNSFIVIVGSSIAAMFIVRVFCTKVCDQKNYNDCKP